ncbi:hypothetical protein GN244_ATG04627 [Phytophthora infestans]|uniref:Uncharacterized protein n=1 Tax=Phytophthora infestans TaxID=4787 RepID=A0A833T486_PHYIN|nr:hypothetical protein GN244_ATG04627 [Phytophthora infestans]
MHGCKLTVPYARRGKLLKCQYQSLVKIFQTGSHATTRPEPRPLHLTRSMKGFARRRAEGRSNSHRFDPLETTTTLMTCGALCLNLALRVMKSNLIHSHSRERPTLREDRSLAMDPTRTSYHNKGAIATGQPAVATGLNDLYYAIAKTRFIAAQMHELENGRSPRDVYHAPLAFSTTNNPVESFNGTLKRDFTLRARMKRGPSGRVSGVQLWFCEEDEESDIVDVISRRVARIYDTKPRRSSDPLLITAQLSEQSSRKKVEGMPVSTTQWSWSCPCLYGAKFLTRVHTLLTNTLEGLMQWIRVIR